MTKPKNPIEWLRGLVERLRVFWNKLLLDRATASFAKCLESDALDAFLELLLRVMKLALIVDPEFRRNIEGYEVRYLFRSRDGKIVTSAIFADGRMQVRTGAIANPDITVVFRDNRALKEFLFTERPDLIGAIVDNEVSYEGNLNYLGKLAYMAKHMQLEVQRRVGPLATVASSG